MFRVEALPAGNGDALLLEWGPSDADVHRMLIDGGVGSSYPSLRARLLQLPTNARGDRLIDLLVITHVDNDHIEGVILALTDPDVRLRPADVWFNGWPQLRRPGSGDLGAKQGEWLGALLERGGLPWNKAFRRADRQRVQVPDPKRLPRRKIAGLELVLLSPTGTQLDVLREDWNFAIRNAGGVPGNVDAAIKQLKANGRLVPEMLGGADDSKTNASSIAFTATYDKRRALLTGDAFRDTVASSLRQLAKDEKSEGPIPINLFKLCHHGSIRNIDGSLLAAMKCSHFLVCTDGSGRSKHPNAATINLIIDTVKGAELIFNYRLPTTSPWSRTSDQKARDYTAVYPKSGVTIVDV